MEGKATLIDRALQGDSRAIGRLYDQYYSVVRRLTFSIDPKAPEDQVHLVLMKVLELLKDPEREFDANFRDRFTGWLFRVAKNVLQDERKRGGRQPRQLSFDGGVAEVSGSAASPSQMAVKGEIEELLKSQVEGLPSLYRQVLELYFFGGRSQKQIADQLGIDLLAVRKRMQRAYSRLRSNLRHLATTLHRARRPEPDC
jgi:RNA polymerase sigma-70 factor (ECF subfamily)